MYLSKWSNSLFHLVIQATTCQQPTFNDSIYCDIEHYLTRNFEANIGPKYDKFLFRNHKKFDLKINYLRVWVLEHNKESQSIQTEKKHGWKWCS